MKSTLYVQHKSGQGPVYEVGLDKGNQYVAKEVGDLTYEYYSLPAKDYLPCDPPDEWAVIVERKK